MAVKKEPRLLIADLIYEIAEQRWTYIRTPSGIQAVEVNSDWPVALNLKDHVRPRLASAFREQYGRVPDKGAVSNALLSIEGSISDQDLPERNPQPRVARDESDRLVVDLDDGSGRAIVIGPERVTVGRTVKASTSVCFSRSAAMGSLPEPDLEQPHDAVFGLLSSIVNMDDASIRLAVGWLVAALMPDVAHPILVLRGEQGTAKSSAGKYLTRIIDNGPAPLRQPPRDVDSWMEAASATWVVCLDNMSYVKDEVSDALCRAVTGDGMVKRKLFTDGEAFVASFRRAIIVTTIETTFRRGDLAERMVPLELLPIGKKRVGEREIEATFREMHPAILGSLVNLTSRVLAELPTVHLEYSPRMADFAEVLAAIDRVMGWDGLTLRAYMESVNDATQDVLDEQPIAEKLLEYLEQHGAWSGSASELLAALEAMFGDTSRPKDWPTNARGITGNLKRMNPSLRLRGWEYEQLPRSNKGRGFTIKRYGA